MSLFRKEAVVQYLDPDARGGLLRVSAPSGARVFAVLAFLFAVALWIAISQRVAITARGRGVLRPPAGIFVVKAPVAGRVVSVDVARGARVPHDASLLTIEGAGAPPIERRQLARLLKQREVQIALLEQEGKNAEAEVLRKASAELSNELDILGRAEDARWTTIDAPWDGVVDALSVRPGDWVDAGQPLLKIVPDGAQTVGLMAIAAEHRAELTVGAKVRLSLDEYPAADAGFGLATITRISDDPLSLDIADPLLATLLAGVSGPLFLVELAPEAMPPRADGQYRNGMVFTGEVVLRSERIISVLFPPLGQLMASR